MTTTYAVTHVDEDRYHNIIVSWCPFQNQDPLDMALRRLYWAGKAEQKLRHVVEWLDGDAAKKFASNVKHFNTQALTTPYGEKDARGCQDRAQFWQDRLAELPHMTATLRDIYQYVLRAKDAMDKVIIGRMFVIFPLREVLSPNAQELTASAGVEAAAAAKKFIEYMPSKDIDGGHIGPIWKSRKYVCEMAVELYQNTHSTIPEDQDYALFRSYARISG